MCTTFAPGAQQAKKKKKPTGIGVTRAYNNPRAFWRTNVDPLQEQQLFFNHRADYRARAIKILKS